MSQHLNDPSQPWSRLTAAARRVRDERDEAAPYGFATRVAALAFLPERPLASLFERFALRAVGVASLLALFSIVLNYQALSTPGSSGMVTPLVMPQAEEPVELVALDDAVAIVLDFAD
jgi:hypothetical protein